MQLGRSHGIGKQIQSVDPMHLSIAYSILPFLNDVIVSDR